MTDGSALKAPGKQAVLLGYLVILLCGAMMLSGAFFGFGWADESNYLAMTDRLFRGDQLIVHEWHPTQWFTVFLLPFYALYHWIAGSADGSLLFMRILYAVVSTGVALVVFRSFCPYKGFWLSLAGALVNLLFARNPPGKFSYNTLPTLALVLMATGAYLYARGRGRRLLPFATGAAFAVAAGSYPYLGALYFAALAGTLVLWKRVTPRWRAFVGYSALGIGAVALPYVAFVLRGGDIKLLINGMRFIFNDPEHHPKTLINVMISYVVKLLRFYRFTLIPSALLLVYVLFKRLARRKFGNAEGLILLLCGVLACCVQIVFRHVEKGTALYSLALLGFQAFLQTEKPDKPLFYGVFLPGFLFTLAVYYASNLGFRGMSAGLSISMIASICLIWECASGLFPPEKRQFSLTAKAATALTLALALGMLALPGAKSAMAWTRLDSKDATIQKGPAAGLIVALDAAERYDAVLAVVREYASGDGNLIITRLAPWAYMASSMRCGAPTTWRLRFNEERLAAYMATFPDRQPDLIISLKPEYDPRGFMWRMPEEYVGPEKVNRVLLDYARDHGMERIDTKAAVLFRRP